MKAKLVKTAKLYALKIDDIIATNDDYFSTKLEHPYRLSTKNCEAIERGYDLDELAKDRFGNSSHHTNNRCSYKEGFQKALEILGDKQFSEENVKFAFNKGYLMKFNPSAEYQKTLNDLRQSLQQTEWEVEVEMVCPHPVDTYRCGIQYGCDEDGCNHPNQVLYLDADGCLILKRVI